MQTDLQQINVFKFKGSCNDVCCLKLQPHRAVTGFAVTLSLHVSEEMNAELLVLQLLSTRNVFPSLSSLKSLVFGFGRLNSHDRRVKLTAPS